jgi:hypothetical protein
MTHRYVKPTCHLSVIRGMILFSERVEATRGVFSGIKIVRPIKRLTMKIIGMGQVSHRVFIRKKEPAYTEPIQGRFVLTGNL